MFAFDCAKPGAKGHLRTGIFFARAHPRRARDEKSPDHHSHYNASYYDKSYYDKSAHNLTQSAIRVRSPLLLRLLAKPRVKPVHAQNDDDSYDNEFAHKPSIP